MAKETYSYGKRGLFLLACLAEKIDTRLRPKLKSQGLGRARVAVVGETDRDVSELNGGARHQVESLASMALGHYPRM